MAGRGPAPKDPSSRQRVNRPVELVKAAPVKSTSPAKRPAPPSGLLKVTRDAWSAFWSSPVAQLVDARSDLPALHRLFELYDDMSRYRASIRKHPMVKGSQGQMVRNPFTKDLEKAQAEARQLEDRFGLTPRARLSLGVTLGEAARSLSDLSADLDFGGAGEVGGDDDVWSSLDVVEGEVVDG